nr:MAG TPA: hypothetical protein [Caudoviricetes sp.]
MQTLVLEVVQLLWIYMVLVIQRLITVILLIMFLCNWMILVY